MDEKIMCECGRGFVQLAHTNKEDSMPYLCCERCAQEAKEKRSMDRSLEMEQLLQLQVLIVEIYAYFDSRYLKHWMKHFVLSPSKRAVWEDLRQFKIIECGRTSFYEQTKGRSMEEYLKEIACISSMGQILVLMEIYDPYLSEKISRAVTLAGKQHRYLVTSRK